MKDVSQPGQYAPFSLCFNYGSLIIFSNLALGGRFKVPDVSLHSAQSESQGGGGLSVLKLTFQGKLCLA